MVFPSWSNFFFDSQLKRTIFFRPYQKQTIFFLSCNSKQYFSPFISFDSLYTMLSSRGITTFTWTFHHVFYKESYCVEFVVQNCWSCVNNFNFWCKVRALDRFKYKLEGDRSEPKNFYNYFPSLQSIDQTFFFLSFREQTIFFPQVAEQTIYFPKFAEQSIFSQKNHSPPPPPPGIKWSAP